MAALKNILPWVLGGIPGGVASKALNQRVSTPQLPDFSSLLTEAKANDAATLEAKRLAAARRNSAMLRSATSTTPRATILTGPAGTLGSAPTATKSLLGQ